MDSIAASELRTEETPQWQKYFSPIFHMTALIVNCGNGWNRAELK